MPNYTKLAESSARSIERAGFLLTITRPVAGVYDPVAGAETGGTTTTGTFKAVALPSSSGKGDFDDTFKAELVKGNIRFFLLAAYQAPFAPEEGDVIPSYQGKRWTLLGCTPLEPDGVNTLLYKITARRT